MEQLPCIIHSPLQIATELGSHYGPVTIHLQGVRIFGFLEVPPFGCFVDGVDGNPMDIVWGTQETWLHYLRYHGIYHWFLNCLKDVPGCE